MQIQVREKCQFCNGAANHWTGSGPISDKDNHCDGYTYRYITSVEWVKSLKGDTLHLLANRLQGMSTREALKK